MYDAIETRINTGRNGGQQVTSSEEKQWVSLHNERNVIMQNEYDSEQKTVLTKVCKKCGVTKPLAGFRYRLTRAQAKQQGYTGSVLVTAEGKVCKDCRPKRKPLSRLTNKELEAKAATGDIPLSIAKARIAQHKKDANLLRKRARIERWHEVWADAWEPLWVDMQADIKGASARVNYARKRKLHDRLKFYEAYVTALRKELNHLKFTFRQNPQRPKYTRWEEYVPEDVQANLKRLWESLPLDERMGGNGTAKMPRMVGYRYDPEANLYKNSKPNDQLNERIKWLKKNNHALPTAPTLIQAPEKVHYVNTPLWERETPAVRLAKYGKPIETTLAPVTKDEGWSDL